MTSDITQSEKTSRKNFFSLRPIQPIVWGCIFISLFMAGCAASAIRNENGTVATPKIEVTLYPTALDISRPDMKALVVTVTPITSPSVNVVATSNIVIPVKTTSVPTLQTSPTQQRILSTASLAVLTAKPSLTLVPILTPTQAPTKPPVIVVLATSTATELATVIKPPTSRPTPMPILPVSPQGGVVRVYPSTIQLRIYDWSQALQASASDDAIYPYPRLSFDKLTGPIDKLFNTLILESPTTKITVLPELGGRILRWVDKRSGRDILYANPVIKPTHWGYRGWWLATGGIEWAFPTNEHGLNEWRAWKATTLTGLDYASITVSDYEDRTGLDIAVTIRLNADGKLNITPHIINATGQPKQFQFWMNAMLPYSAQARFVVPTADMQVHSTEDKTLPAAGQGLTWPNFNGRDFSVAMEWHKYLGLFATSLTGGRAAVVYPQHKLVREFPYTQAKGIKLFLLGDLPASLYTDGDSRYLEFWGGLTRTFDQNTSLASGGSISWTETWFIE